jgi:hypothetical protein
MPKDCMTLLSSVQLMETMAALWPLQLKASAAAA